MDVRYLGYALIVVLLPGCAGLGRSSGSGYSANTYETRSSEKYGRSNFDRQTAYELGKDPSSLNANDYDEIRNRQYVKQLERTLASKKEKEQYSKVLPWLNGDQEKISFLSVPSIEGRQQWINKNRIWSRSKAPREDLKNLIEAQDIAIGMPQDYVKRSWGEPLSVDVSGNPVYKNERWKYQKYVSGPEGYRQEVRYVYFEGGRVVGWETE